MVGWVNQAYVVKANRTSCKQLQRDEAKYLLQFF